MKCISLPFCTGQALVLVRLLVVSLRFSCLFYTSFICSTFKGTLYVEYAVQEFECKKFSDGNLNVRNFFGVKNNDGNDQMFH